MDLNKLHKGKWVLSAERSVKDPDVVNMKVSSVDGSVLEYSVILINPRTSQDADKKQIACDSNKSA